MSEKKELEMNEIDMQAVIADWIVANDGCGDYNEVSCSGDYGRFKGVRCPISRSGRRCYLTKEEELIRLNEWLGKYNQQKAEAAEKDGQEEGKTCGSCSYFSGANGEYVKATQGIALCRKKRIRVPVEFIGCYDFEPRASGSKDDHVASEGGTGSAERIAQRKKDTEELCALVELYAAEYAGSKRAHAETKKDKSNLVDKNENLTEQRNRLSNILIQTTCRVKELEQENTKLRKMLDVYYL